MIAVGVSVLLCLQSLTAPAQAGLELNRQEEPPLNKEQLIEVLKVQGKTLAQKNRILITEMNSRGVDFELTPAIESELRSAGASSQMLEATRVNYRSRLTPERQPSAAENTARGNDFFQQKNYIEAEKYYREAV